MDAEELMDPYVRMPVSRDRALSYLRNVLGDMTLAGAMRRRMEHRGATFDALATADFHAEDGLPLSQSRRLSPSASRAALAQIIHDVLNRNTTLSFMIEDAESRQGDAWLDDARSVVRYSDDRAAYHFPRATSVNAIGDCISAAGSWPGVGAVGASVAIERASLDASSIDLFVDTAVMCFVTVFDAESFLLIEWS